VPAVTGLDVDAARQRIKETGFQVNDQTNSVNSSARYGEVVGTSPAGQTIPGSVVTILISNGIRRPRRHPCSRKVVVDLAVGRRRRSDRRSSRFRPAADHHSTSGAPPPPP